MTDPNDQTDWLEVNNVGISIGFFFKAAYSRGAWTPAALVQVFIDAVWH